MSCCSSTPQTPVAKGSKPPWLRLRLPTSPVFAETTGVVRGHDLHTVCESAHCPNRFECWSRGTATFMVGGDHCTRNCGFCAVHTAKPLALDTGEPERIAQACARMKLRHVVITMVARDDLSDGASAHVSECILAARKASPSMIIEVLTSDFNGREEDIARVLEARPEIFSHNLETVERLTPSVRSRATYRRSLEVMRFARQTAPDLLMKSGIMLGLGETDDEIRATLSDMRSVGIEIVTLGQYLQPSPNHLPVLRWVTPEEFSTWEQEARAMGFTYVASGPLVRSSYYADAVNLESLHAARSPTLPL